MVYTCAQCGSPAASNNAHCCTCGAPAATHDDGSSSLLPALKIAALVLVLCAMGWGLRIARKAHLGNTTITIATPRQNSDFNLGASLYSPSSPASPDGLDHVIFVQNGTTYSARADYVTYDSVDRVLQFYQTDLGPQAITKRGLIETTVTLKTDSIVGTDKVVVTLVPYVPNHNPAVMTKTIIHIAHTRTAAAS